MRHLRPLKRQRKTPKTTKNKIEYNGKIFVVRHTYCAYLNFTEFFAKAGGFYPRLGFLRKKIGIFAYN